MDMDLLVQREKELTNIYRFGGYSFLGVYSAASIGRILVRKQLPYFKDVVKHTVLAGCGTFCAAASTEKIASEIYYNRLLI